MQDRINHQPLVSKKLGAGAPVLRLRRNLIKSLRGFSIDELRQLKFDLDALQYEPHKSLHTLTFPKKLRSSESLLAGVNRQLGSLETGDTADAHRSSAIDFNRIHNRRATKPKKFKPTYKAGILSKPNTLKKQVKVIEKKISSSKALPREPWSLKPPNNSDSTLKENARFSSFLNLIQGIGEHPLNAIFHTTDQKLNEAETTSAGEEDSTELLHVVEVETQTVDSNTTVVYVDQFPPAPREHFTNFCFPSNGYNAFHATTHTDILESTSLLDDVPKGYKGLNYNHQSNRRDFYTPSITTRESIIDIKVIAMKSAASGGESSMKSHQQRTAGGGGGSGSVSQVVSSHYSSQRGYANGSEYNGGQSGGQSASQCACPKCKKKNGNGSQCNNFFACSIPPCALCCDPCCCAPCCGSCCGCPPCGSCCPCPACCACPSGVTCCCNPCCPPCGSCFAICPGSAPPCLPNTPNAGTDPALADYMEYMRQLCSWNGLGFCCGWTNGGKRNGLEEEPKKRCVCYEDEEEEYGEDGEPPPCPCCECRDEAASQSQADACPCEDCGKKKKSKKERRSKS